MASLLIIVHLTAVFIAPFAFVCTSPGGRSPFAYSVWNLFQPYVELSFLNHGYAFFAPDPGPSHLIRAHIEFDDGRETRDEIFPNLQDQRPRLLYHRHFMLAEQLHASFRPADPPPELANDPAEVELWRMARQAYEDRKRAFEEHLRAKYGAARVSITRIEHRLLDPREVRYERLDDDHPETYIDLPDSAASEPTP